MCPGSSDPFYIASLQYKMGHYFLDTQYIHLNIYTYIEEKDIDILLNNYKQKMVVIFVIFNSFFGPWERGQVQSLSLIYCHEGFIQHHSNIMQQLDEHGYDLCKT